ncbi:PepSY-like domain-containing protein [Spirosoma aerophilum]
MKKQLVFLGWLLVSPFVLSAQEIPATAVPASVKQALKAKFPSATDIDWKKVGGQYKASFDLGKVDHDAVFTASGQLSSHDYDMAYADVPAAVKAAVSKQFPAYRPDGADKQEANGRITYKIELDGTPDLTVILSADGKVLRKMTDTD